jgi:hypothetical protein
MGTTLKWDEQNLVHHMLKGVMLWAIMKDLPRKGLSPAEACGSLCCLSGGFEV